MPWAGWGAGPAGAGATGGPTKAFLRVALFASVAVTMVLAVDGKASAWLTGLVSVYFGLRVFGVIGPKQDPR